MRCPGCRKEINDKSDQCEFCGSPIKNITVNKEEIKNY